MINLTDIREHMELIDRDGRHLGTVDGVEGKRVKLTREDSVDGRHHYVDADSLDHVEGGKLMLRAGAQMSEAQIAAASEYHATADSPLNGAESRPLFGTAGEGTGQGGAGSAQH